MTAPIRAAAAGTKYNFAGFLDTFGYLTGASPTAPPQGATGSGMMHFKGIKTASPTVPEPDTVQVTSDDDLTAEFQFTSIATRRFTIDYGIQDLDQNALLTGTTNETVGEAIFGAIDVADTAELDMCMLIQGRSKKQDASNLGQKAWQGVLVMLATAIPLGRVSYGEREAAAYRLSISPQLAGYNPWGVTIQNSVQGTTGMRYRPVHSDYPIHMMRHVGTGALATFNLDYEPISAAKMKVYVNRVAATVLSVDTAAKTYTLSAPVAENAAILTAYEFAG